MRHISQLGKADDSDAELVQWMVQTARASHHVIVFFTRDIKFLEGTGYTRKQLPQNLQIVILQDELATLHLKKIPATRHSIGHAPKPTLRQMLQALCLKLFKY